MVLSFIKPKLCIKHNLPTAVELSLIIVGVNPVKKTLLGLFRHYSIENFDSSVKFFY